MRDAISYWYWNVSDSGNVVVFRDACSGPHCSNSCPEQISLQAGSSALDAWSKEGRAIVAAIILLISIVSVMMKVFTTVCKFAVTVS